MQTRRGSPNGWAHAVAPCRLAPLSLDVSMTTNSRSEIPRKLQKNSGNIGKIFQRKTKRSKSYEDIRSAVLPEDQRWATEDFWFSDCIWHAEDFKKWLKSIANDKTGPDGSSSQAVARGGDQFIEYLYDTVKSILQDPCTDHSPEDFNQCKLFLVP